MSRERVQRPASGFTLAELTVVIAVVALLISVLLPALRVARFSAYRVGCMSNLRQAGLLMRTYMDGTGGGVLPAFPSFASHPTQGDDAIGLWELLSEQGGIAPPAPGNTDHGLAVCPADPAAPANAELYGFSYRYLAGSFMDTSRSPDIDPRMARFVTKGYELGYQGPVIHDAIAFNGIRGLERAELHHPETPDHSTHGNALFYDGHVDWDRRRTRTITNPTRGR